MKPRPIRIEGDIAYVPLTKGYEAVIDAADVPIVAGFNWHAAISYGRDGAIRTVYARRKARADGKKKTVALHRVLLGGIGSPEVDHRDGNGLNNRRANLRAATTAQNQFNRRRCVANTSGFKGVHWNKQTQKWRAMIREGGKQIHLGLFETPEAAHAAYAEASFGLRRDFARAD